MRLPSVEIILTVSSLFLNPQFLWGVFPLFFIGLGAAESRISAISYPLWAKTGNQRLQDGIEWCKGSLKAGTEVMLRNHASVRAWRGNPQLAALVVGRYSG
jgi:hypothetical protein